MRKHDGVHGSGLGQPRDPGRAMERIWRLGGDAIRQLLVRKPPLLGQLRGHWNSDVPPSDGHNRRHNRIEDVGRKVLKLATANSRGHRPPDSRWNRVDVRVSLARPGCVAHFREQLGDRCNGRETHRWMRSVAQWMVRAPEYLALSCSAAIESHHAVPCSSHRWQDAPRSLKFSLWTLGIG